MHNGYRRRIPDHFALAVRRILAQSKVDVNYISCGCKERRCAGRADPFALRGGGSRKAGLAMAYKLLDSAQQRWRRVNAPHLVARVRVGAVLIDGRLQEREKGQEATAERNAACQRKPTARQYARCGLRCAR